MLRPKSFSVRSGDQLCEQIRVNIAAGEHDDDVFAAGIDATGEQSG